MASRAGIVTVLQVYLGIYFANQVLIPHFLHNVRFFTSKLQLQVSKRGTQTM